MKNREQVIDQILTLMRLSSGSNIMTSTHREYLNHQTDEELSKIRDSQIRYAQCLGQ